MENIIFAIMLLSFSEKKVLWATVLAIFIIYFTLAAKFHFDTQ